MGPLASGWCFGQSDEQVPDLGVPIKVGRQLIASSWCSKPEVGRRQPRVTANPGIPVAPGKRTDPVSGQVARCRATGEPMSLSSVSHVEFE